MDPSKALTEKERSKFKSYSEGVLSALRAFDKAGEWPDLLKYLQRLHKAVDKQTNFPIIPEKLLMTRRLAQCLNPALPGGVHMKALEVVESVFNKLDSDHIAQNLEFGIGLFPLFRTASISVRGKFLYLIEKFYVPLGPKLLPCIEALVM